MWSRDLKEFECERCGTCCQLSGFVRVKKKEIKAIARFLDLSLAEARERFVTAMGPDGPDERDEEILQDQPGSDRCIFLTDDNQCRVHSVKPAQCRTFPHTWVRAGANLYCSGLKQLAEKKRER
jgi:hypothetical protein